MEPQTIVDQPIPLLEGGMTDLTGQNTNPVASSVFIPNTHVDVVFPPKIIAHETIGESLNTKSQSILAQYTFEELGAILVGMYQQGVSGEIKISPNGIVARNSGGETTFALDGATGDATFKGTIEAADFVIADENGLISLNNFESQNVNASTQTITSTSYIDLTDLSLTTTNFPRTKKVLIFFEVLMQIDASDHASGFTGAGQFRFDIDGVAPGSSPIIQEAAIRAAGYTDNCNYHFVTMFYLATLNAGVHTIKVKGKVSNTVGTGALDILVGDGHLFYMVLGG